MMAKVEVYSSMLCGYCYRAKKLLEQKGVAFTEIDVMVNSSRRAEMVQRSGGRSSVPLVFIDDHYIGGCAEHYALQTSRKLDGLPQPGGRRAGGNHSRPRERTAPPPLPADAH